MESIVPAHDVYKQQPLSGDFLQDRLAISGKGSGMKKRAGTPRFAASLGFGPPEAPP